jgi:hypothetical protein
LLLSELKLRGMPAEPKTDWGKFTFKWIVATAIGVTLGWLLRQVNGTVDLSSWAIFIGILFGGMGIAAVDEFFGWIIFINFYMSRVDSPYAVWVGIGIGAAFALIWLFFIARRKFRKALEAVKKQYDL